MNNRTPLRPKPKQDSMKVKRRKATAVSFRNIMRAHLRVIGGNDTPGAMRAHLRVIGGNDTPGAIRKKKMVRTKRHSRRGLTNP